MLLVRGFHYGMFTAITPMMGANYVGWDEAAITAAAGTAQLVAGILGLTLGGWLGDRFGAKRTTIAFFALYITFSGVMLMTQSQWADSRYFMFFVYSWYALDILITVAALPISMRLCDQSVAATQFTLYMACSNLGITIGATVFGFSDQLGGLTTMFMIVMALHFVGLMVMLFARFPRRAGYEETKVLAEAPGPAPRIN